MQQITPLELKQRLDSGEPLTLLDVRESWEFQLCHINNSLHIPLGDILASQSFEQLDKQIEIIAICHHGIRSLQAATQLQRNGFERITNLQGGVHHWALQVDPNMARY